MKTGFTPREGSALYRLLSEVTSDIILKTDCRGFILHSSPGIERFGISLSNSLVGPHLRELVHPDCAAAIERQHAAAIAGRDSLEWMEFRARTQDGRERWFEMRTQSLTNERGQVYGGLSIVRDIDERRALQEQVFAAAMTDPLTGLSNRAAFVSMLRHMVEEGAEGCVALFALDQLKAVNMRYGQSVGDEVLVTFAEILRRRLRSQDIVSRFGGDCLGVLLPGAEPERAEAICKRGIAALAKKRPIAGAGELSLAASGGVVRIGGSVDETLKRAEMTLFLAKARGRNRLEVDGKVPQPWARTASAA